MLFGWQHLLSFLGVPRNRMKIQYVIF
jgi:hypothetical protein